MKSEALGHGTPAYILFEETGLCKTRSEARRLLSQGGGYIGGERIQAFDQIIDSGNFTDNSLLIRAGKKKYMRIILNDPQLSLIIYCSR